MEEVRRPNSKRANAVEAHLDERAFRKREADGSTPSDSSMANSSVHLLGVSDEREVALA